MKSVKEDLAADHDERPAEHVESPVARIYEKYRAAYDGEIQGCCPLIADEIQRAIGGEVVAGKLTWNGGACERTHWWVVKDGAVIDPMGDHLLSFEDWPARKEAHRDRWVFEAILPDYERWRVA